MEIEFVKNATRDKKLEQTALLGVKQGLVDVVLVRMHECHVSSEGTRKPCFRYLYTLHAMELHDAVVYSGDPGPGRVTACHR